MYMYPGLCLIWESSRRVRQAVNPFGSLGGGMANDNIKMTFGLTFECPRGARA